MKKSKRIGRCLCGAVEVSVDFSMTDMGACHCKLCRKWSGGPLFEVECGINVSFQGQESIAVFQASKRAERGFCLKCGTHLFIKALPSGEYGIPPGLFDDDEGIQFNRQVFIDHKPSYFAFANETKDIDSDFIYQHYPETKED